MHSPVIYCISFVTKTGNVWNHPPLGSHKMPSALYLLQAYAYCMLFWTNVAIANNNYVGWIVL